MLDDCCCCILTSEYRSLSKNKEIKRRKGMLNGEGNVTC